MTTLAKYTYLGLGTVIQVDYAEPDVRYDLVTGGSSTDPYGGLDRFGRVTDLLWQKYSGTPTDLVRLGYGYDRVSNRTYREDQVAAGGFDELYAYDGIHRLKDFDRGDLNANKDAITSPTLEQSWGLDTTGNWSTFDQNVPGTSSQDLTQSRTHSKVNEITGITETVGASWVTPQHDRNGNMAFMPQPAQPTEGFTATYDAWNRLVKLEEDVEPGSSSSSSSSSESSSSSSSSSESGSISRSSSESASSSSSSSEEPLVVTYAYDGQHWRTEKNLNGEPTHFFYSNEWQCLEERDNTSTDAHNQYVWGLRYIDDLVLRDRDTTGNGTLDERLYYLQDANWNIGAILNPSGGIIERYAFDAYGVVMFLDGQFVPVAQNLSNRDNSYLFTGRRRDIDTLFYSYRSRDFCAQLGRFVGRDPAGYVDTHSLYEYVSGQPIDNTDPYGLILATSSSPTGGRLQKDIPDSDLMSLSRQFRTVTSRATRVTLPRHVQNRTSPNGQHHPARRTAEFCAVDQRCRQLQRSLPHKKDLPCPRGFEPIPDLNKVFCISCGGECPPKQCCGATTTGCSCISTCTCRLLAQIPKGKRGGRPRDCPPHYQPREGKRLNYCVFCVGRCSQGVCMPRTRLPPGEKRDEAYCACEDFT